MLYATWIIDRTDGTTPEPAIRAAAGTASGGLMLNDDLVLGYITGKVDVENFNKWDVKIITETEALELSRAKNPKCFINDFGLIEAERDYIN